MTNAINIITGTPFSATFNNGTNTFTIAGHDYTNLFVTNAILTVLGGTPNGGYQKVTSSTFTGGNTVVTVTSYSVDTTFPGPTTFSTGTGIVLLMTNVASPAGFTWTTLTTGFEADGNYSDLTYQNGLWVISTVTGTGVRGFVLTSPDRTTWTKSLLPVAATGIQYMSKPQFGNGVWVISVNITDGSDLIFTSPDTVTWTQRSWGFAGTNNDVAISPYGNGTFVAVQTFGSGGGGAQYATSPDGITWTMQTAFNAGQWQPGNAFNAGNGNGGFIFDGTQFVTFVTLPSASVNNAVTSTDGINWTPSTTTYNNSPAGLAFDGTHYVMGFASGDSGFIGTNPLLINTPITFADVFSDTENLAFGGGSWARVYDADTAVDSSPNGTTWTADASTAGGSATLYSVAFGQSHFIATGLFFPGNTSFAMVRAA